VVPPDGGQVDLAPAGPWYPSNQLVVLTATPAPGFGFPSWTGADTDSANPAQFTMTHYRAVTALFPSITLGNPALTRLPDGRIQFGVSVGPGTPQVTIWGATSLNPPDWTIIGTLPLTGGSGVFTEDPAPTAPACFYRVTVP
jgi:hypothetical protein